MNLCVTQRFASCVFLVRGYLCMYCYVCVTFCVVGQFCCIVWFFLCLSSKPKEEKIKEKTKHQETRGIFLISFWF